MTNAHDSIAQDLKEAIELNHSEKVANQRHKSMAETKEVIQEENAAEPAGDHKGSPYN
jgi:hypothetical protein